jgi:hypothetical protein
MRSSFPRLRKPLSSGSSVENETCSRGVKTGFRSPRSRSTSARIIAASCNSARFIESVSFPSASSVSAF